ncbi:hypothetical protein RhiirA1_439346 [Rhizophagus irregularis]|uniref:Restriction endonuclease domain-containing protein n=3 Tax=Rhizophagus irregularis TaxID=588596 RepID=U9TZ57_RHIID|nr:hypothetical protein GLOIN_2v1546814 [Rhizophagus irregularis DAOM 181602=DAOM 197198]EXX70313.1 hypothetical protein RirG_088450 [Rhizophagus irregularis DAOM 197198w]PKC70634.1 hypothetical protein RhiirA1_439346 [Rhizophagus irregularis]POG77446.1 hypothetical protein GLOIN_2v1546814 [Rhizophagus irregularis DAOM 181602=DAOM 197198]UZO12412.1 hypothetical protein OCT59_003950 [Rhizophagus irregularis]CAB4468674.1 unnamed protein product [Rhizophagus irregularis]|eukprot:XP_025184312.1 hypothetical protein GLOIN_2v1546814 [Rhizophagus irregularis DAOM 181602=DAOM 197198]
MLSTIPTFTSYSPRRTLRSKLVEVKEVEVVEEVEEMFAGFSRTDTENDNVINEANEEEKKWWDELSYENIDKKRLPLRLTKNVKLEEYIEKSEIADAGKFWNFDAGNVTVVELPNPDHEVAHTQFTRQFLSAFSNVAVQDDVDNIAGTSCIDGASAKQPDAAFVPVRLPKPSPYPCDLQGNPWPTIVCEVANTQSLSSIFQKVNEFWLRPNRAEDVIVLKLWPWNGLRNAGGNPLRRLTCYKFCCRLSRHLRSGYRPIRVIEFGTIDSQQRPINNCSARGMCILRISPSCIYLRCPGTPPYPLTNDVSIDLYNIQQAIFRKM